ACIPHPFPFLFFAAPPPIPLRRKASGRKEMGAGATLLGKALKVGIDFIS
ncbi:MAG: hypothetical protein UT74_C0017G0008, partial [Parcubacteria group bacterium GW2011_GWC1_40_11]